MRHRVYGKHLGRNKDERKTLFKGLIYSLISFGTIQTSETKAKAIKGLVDKVINLAKGKNTKNQLQSSISDKSLRERLVNDILPKLGNRTSGYTSMMRMGTRSGDQTMMVKMSLIGAEELKPIEKKSIKKIEEPKVEKVVPVKKITEKKVPAKRKTVKK